MKGKIMWKIVLAIGILTVLFMVGCDAVQNPDSSLNQVIDTIEKVAPAIGSSAVATATPIGASIGIAAAVLTTLAGVYNNYKKKIVIADQDGLISHQYARLSNITLTTKAIVEAVESLSNSDEIKSEIKEHLQDKEIYKVGKAIIAGLK